MNDGSVNEPTTQPSADLNTALAAFGVPKVNRRGARLRVVMGKAKYGYQRPRGTNPETGKEPQYSRPSLDEWTPQYPSVRPACFAGDFLYGLSGIDELRVANRRVHEPRYAK